MKTADAMALVQEMQAAIYKRQSYLRHATFGFTEGHLRKEATAWVIGEFAPRVEDFDDFSTIVKLLEMTTPC